MSSKFYHSTQNVVNVVAIILLWSSPDLIPENVLVTSTLSVLAATIVVYLTTLLWKRRYESMRDPDSPLPLPPGEMGWPIVGESLLFALKGAQFFVDQFKKYGLVYKTHLLGSATVRVSGADYLWPLISKEPHLLSMKIPVSTRHLFGQHSLPVVTGQDHARLKKRLYASVTPVRLDDYLPCIQEHMRAHILSWCEQGRILGFQACEELICEIMLEVVLGWRKEHDPQGVVRTAFKTVNQNLFCFPVKIPGGGFHKADKARKIICDFVKKRLESEGDKDHVCMLDVFLVGHGEDNEDGDDRASLTTDEIIDNAVTFLLAGSGTTSGALSCLLLMLGKHPEVLDQLREELSSQGLMSAGNGMDLSYDLLQSLQFTNCISKEVLRLHPPAGGAFRRAEQTLEVGGYQIPKGWTVIYSIRDTHFHTTAMENREKFLPERWQDKMLEERLRKKDVCHYMPFGQGPRSCIGKSLALMEMAAFLVEITRLVTWKLHNPDVGMVYLPVTKAADDLPVTFTRQR